jgi:rhamnosyltransferase
MRTNKRSGIDDIDFCITSGSLLNLKIWNLIGGFDEKMFIDGVDFDYCIRIKKNGFTIKRLNYVKLDHEIGHGKKVRLFRRNALVLNHSKLRLYYISRNYLYLGFKHRQHLKWFIEVAKRILLVLLYEKQKFAKLHYMFKGIAHCLLGNFGKYN